MPTCEPTITAPDEKTGLLDTSVVARYLVGDVPELAARARALIDSARPLRVSIIVLAETGFLLTRFYGIERARVVNTLVDLLNRENIDAHEIDTDLAIQALMQCHSSGRVSFADALLWATARSAGASTVWTFDRRFPAADIDVAVP